jgi:hypothetical protein
MVRFLITLSALLAFALPAFAGSDTEEMPTIGGVGVIAEHGTPVTASKGFVGTVVYLEADDDNVWVGPGGAELDAGDEACAVYGMTCALVWTITTGASPAITVDADGCTNDASISDEAESLVICY